MNLFMIILCFLSIILIITLKVYDCIKKFKNQEEIPQKFYISLKGIKSDEINYIYTLKELNETCTNSIFWNSKENLEIGDIFEAVFDESGKLINLTKTNEVLSNYKVTKTSKEEEISSFDICKDIDKNSIKSIEICELIK